MFAFVTVSHPDEIKDKKKQGCLRQHAIRNGIQRSKAERAKKAGVFVPVEIDGKTGQSLKRTPPNVDTITTQPSISHMDPFDTLCGCPDRLRALMRHPSAKQAGEPIFCVEDSGKPLFQGMETIFQGALADPSLFHALSLVLSLAANNNQPNVEVLTHRGELLSGIRLNIKGLNGIPKVSTITAMLLLVSYEYRIDGSNSKTIAAHIKGIQTMMKICKSQNVVLIDEVQRALFWQDLLSCLMAGTPRFLSHMDFQDFQSPKAVDRSHQWDIPSGFTLSIAQWPPEFAIILQDLNALSRLVDSQCADSKQPIDVFPIDNNQANLESRLVDLLSKCRTSTEQTDPWYEASILGAYLCTYKLSTGIWMGCYIPEICISEILKIFMRVPRGPQWEIVPDLLKWLLFISGGMTDRKELKLQVARLLREIFPDPGDDFEQQWDVLRKTLRSFIWCRLTMERRVFLFWKDVYSRSNHAWETERYLSTA